jgi:propanediol dehydratase-reactivating factor small subunit
MSEPVAPRPPTIAVLDAGAPAEVLRQVRAGAEEEGVPVEVRTVAPSDSPAATAHLGAGESPLRVGVALYPDGAIAVQHATLPPEAPAHTVPAPPASPETGPAEWPGEWPGEWRRAGRIAARIVTRLPLA